MSRNNSAVDELKTTSDSGRRGATYEVVFAKGRERLQSDAKVVALHSPEYEKFVIHTPESFNAGVDELKFELSCVL